MQTNTDVFNEVLNHALEALTEGMTDPVRESRPQSLADPRLTDLFSAKAALLQTTLAEKLSAQSDENPQDVTISSRLLRTLVLMDRTQSRIARAHPKAPAPAADLSIQREDAHRFLITELSISPKPAAELLAAANKLGIAKRTLLRAKADLSITSHVAFRDDKTHCWMWKFTPSPTSTPAIPPVNL